MNEMYIHKVRYMDIVSGHPREYMVGMNEVIEIKQPDFLPESAKEYVDIYFNNGDMVRLFNIDQILFKQKQKIDSNKLP